MAAGAALLAGLALLGPGAAASGAGQAADSDLDRFMARVLERRDEAWRRLHDYILSERESFRLLGPGDVPLHGMRREYTWYVREGFLVRSPTRFDGVTLGEEDRRAYEEKWLREEKERDRRSRERQAKGEREGPAGKQAPVETPAPGEAQESDPSLQDFVDQRGEPRFVSEAYFLRFKFEPGNYYLVGRERLEGREVLKIEYYPTRLFGSDEARDDRGRDEPDERQARQRRRGRDPEDEIDRQLNKVSLVTLWVDPSEHQIVRYTFENTDFGFLPGRWLVRADEARASMSMARVLDGVWLPSRITMAAALSLASGGYRFAYGREFFDYRKAEVGARIRSYVPKEP